MIPAHLKPELVEKSMAIEKFQMSEGKSRRVKEGAFLNGTYVIRSSFIVHRSSFIVHRSSFIVHRSSFIALLYPFTNKQPKDHRNQLYCLNTQRLMVHPSLVLQIICMKRKKLKNLKY